MMLLTGPSLQKAIYEIEATSRFLCAVAFWGNGSETIIPMPQPPDLRLICNLKMGGTNPNVIRTMRNANISLRQHDRLHAKIYIGDTKAIVTSANASINGLGLEGRELQNWIEVGVEIPAEKALAWFEQTWSQSQEISNADLQNAAHFFFQRLRPSRGSFNEFFPGDSDFPLIDWQGNSSYIYVDENIVQQIGYVNPMLHERIDTGHDVESEADITIFYRDRWVLRWDICQNGMPDKRSSPGWTCSSGVIVKDAFQYDDEGTPRSVILAREQMPPKPFDATERQFRDAFYQTISLKKYVRLRSQNYQGSFIVTRYDLMREFWSDLRKFYGSH